MRFGIIGAGVIGTNISKKLVKNGHDVKIAETRGIEHLEGRELDATPANLEDVITNIDVLIISLPSIVVPSIRNIVDKVGEEVIVVDTSNYYPFRDSKIEEIESGMVESVWISNQLGRPIIKAFNNQLAYTLENKGTPKGASGRIAYAIADDNLAEIIPLLHIGHSIGSLEEREDSIDDWSYLMHFDYSVHILPAATVNLAQSGAAIGEIEKVRASVSYAR